MTSIAQTFKETINSNIGEVVDNTMFDLPRQTISTYLSLLTRNGILERQSRGKYKVLREMAYTNDLRYQSSDFYQEILDKFSVINPNKQVVERICFSTAEQYIRNKKCMILSGPDYGPHCEKLFDSGMASFLYVVERIKGVYDQIIEQANECSHYQTGNVQIDNNDVSEKSYSDCHYINLDIFGSYNNVLPLVERYITDQKNLDGFKCMYFAIARRQSGSNDVLFNNVKLFLHTFFGSDLTGVNNIEGSIGKESVDMAVEKRSQHFCRQYMPTFASLGNLIDFKWFSYADGTGMMGFQIIYK